MRTVDNLFRLGADVIYSALANVHVSGHASQDDLKLVLNLLKPQYCVPFHGEYRHMVLFRRVAEAVGIHPDRTLLAGVGQVLEFGEGQGALGERVATGSVFVEGATIGEVSQTVLRDRRQLSRDGVVIAVLALDRQTGRLVLGPDLVSRGFVYARDSSEDVLEAAKEGLREELERSGDPGVEVEFAFVTHKIKDFLSNYLYQHTGRHPLVLPVVTEV